MKMLPQGSQLLRLHMSLWKWACEIYQETDYGEEWMGRVYIRGNDLKPVSCYQSVAVSAFHARKGNVIARSD